MLGLMQSTKASHKTIADRTRVGCSRVWMTREYPVGKLTIMCVPNFILIVGSNYFQSSLELNFIISILQQTAQCAQFAQIYT